MRRGTTRTSASQEDENDEEALGVLTTELALGSDGRIYVNAEGIDPARLKGRKMFRGYALTSAEAKRAQEELHRLAFNITVSAKPALKPKAKIKDPRRGRQETKAQRLQQNRRPG